MKMVEIVMLRSDRGAPEGHTVFDYAEGATVTVPEDLALAFIASGSAKMTDETDEETARPDNEGQRDAGADLDSFDVAKGPSGRWFVTDNGELQKPGYPDEDAARAALADLRKPPEKN